MTPSISRCPSAEARSLAVRAATLFGEHRRSIYERTDRIFVALMLG